MWSFFFSFFSFVFVNAYTRWELEQFPIFLFTNLSYNVHSLCNGPAQTIANICIRRWKIQENEKTKKSLIKQEQIMFCTALLKCVFTFYHVFLGYFGGCSVCWTPLKTENIRTKVICFVIILKNSHLLQWSIIKKILSHTCEISKIQTLLIMYEFFLCADNHFNSYRRRIRFIREYIGMGLSDSVAREWRVKFKHNRLNFTWTSLKFR